jgi:thiol-disulfide isomerase/thioredoxin
MRSVWIGVLAWINVSMAFAQPVIQQGPWRGQLLREDGQIISFHFDTRQEKGKQVLYVINASERLKVDKIRQVKDSIIIDMPVFESQFRVKKISDQRWEGKWIKGGSTAAQVMPFIAQLQQALTPETIAKPVADITGRWSVTFTQPNNLSRPAIGEWQQKGYTLRGTFLTPSGDYRYLSGVVNGDSLRLSTFDGSHAYLFTAKLNSDRQITGGIFYSGAIGKQTWTAYKNDTASLPDLAAMYVKDGQEKLHFRFRDLNKKWVSLTDPKFKNKVVIIQIMGSWCPNCMDETAFLSEFYNRNRHRGVEVIALAYEYSTDWERSKKSIQKFKDRFSIKYTILNTEVTVSDSLRTEKTLPQLTQIKSFPSTIFLDKKGRVTKLHAGFEGPGTGEHYEALKKEFAATVDELLKDH